MTTLAHNDATWAAGLLALCGEELGGALMSEEAEGNFLAAFSAAMPEQRIHAVPAGVTLEALSGALDLAETLATGKPVLSCGLLDRDEPETLLLRRAERIDLACAAAIADALDRRSILLLAVTTSRPDDEPVAQRLLDRLPFVISAMAEAVWSPELIYAARNRLSAVTVAPAWISNLVDVAMMLAIPTPRAAIQAVEVARAVAALRGADAVGEEDVTLAARLVFAPRAQQLPPPPDEDQEQEQPPPQDRQSQAEAVQSPPGQPENAEIIVEAVKASLPDHILADLVSGQGRKGAGRNMKVNAQRKGNGQRGRKTGQRRATSLARQRLDVLATLRTAAPWQPVRRKLYGGDRLLVLRDDFRVARIKQRNEATAIFAVDASGSTAFQRLAEAKGAVETVLAECYVRRDKVALVSFRSKTAEVLLPPTRSLERAKRALSSMPGGGGTPLAAGLDQAFAVALQVKRGGGTPTIIMLTDGRANVTREGEGNKVKALEETMASARRLAAEGIDAMVIDVSPEPKHHARALADAMQARYLPMPRAGAHDIARPVNRALRALTQ
ncbi:MAG: VWA domain-containing protein [Rhizobiales bacterium]|nr:VWA domain-containing protein [Hyphomicrobiales bacterium]